ncbi:glycosyltransferase family 25 protein [Thaumasiovibrio subtropicus]|uniref:glycosyltransferase family 25 protein n=1 Tax=Thaumasiovibrio subtropicus TaxID=1891207 RepID=UPI000B355CEB|nr:glycosyltransferase family 25 protein [Thaumasiovibrio subtropicus]
MKAVVISLESKIERYKWTRSQLKQIPSLAIEKLSAVDARADNPHALMGRYNEQRFFNLNGRTAAPGEIGCYASHYLAWQRCVELNEPIVVFEDDIQIDAQLFNHTIEAAKAHIAECGYIRLENYSKKREHNYTVASLGHHQRLIRHIKTPLCMTAYAITPSVAKAFIKKSNEFLYPVDVFMRNIWIHKKPTYGITPAGLTGGKFDSAIGTRNFKHEKTVKTKAFKLLSKSRDVAFNGLYNFTYAVTVKKSRPTFQRHR